MAKWFVYVVNIRLVGGANVNDNDSTGWYLLCRESVPLTTEGRDQEVAPTGSWFVESIFNYEIE